MLSIQFASPRPMQFAKWQSSPSPVIPVFISFFNLLSQVLKAFSHRQYARKSVSPDRISPVTIAAKPFTSKFRRSRSHSLDDNISASPILELEPLGGGSGYLQVATPSHSVPTTPLLFQISGPSDEPTPFSSPRLPHLPCENIPDLIMTPEPTSTQYYRTDYSPLYSTVRRSSHQRSRSSPSLSPTTSSGAYASIFGKVSTLLAKSVRASSELPTVKRNVSNHQRARSAPNRSVQRSASRVFKFLDSSMNLLQDAVTGFIPSNPKSPFVNETDPISAASFDFIVKYATLCGVHQRTITHAILDSVSFLETNPFAFNLDNIIDDVSFDPSHYPSLVKAFMCSLKNNNVQTDHFTKKLRQVSIKDSTTTFQK